jgi:hypothetical protein
MLSFSYFATITKSPAEAVGLFDETGKGLLTKVVEL